MPINAENIKHIPFTIPTSKWAYYQEWNKSVFLHYKIEVALIRELVPEELEIDTINGETWLSIVAFTMEKIRPRNLPSIDLISNFHEINLRAYVIHNNIPGVFFINIEAEKLLSVILSKSMSGLPYEKSKIIRIENIENNSHQYASINTNKNFELYIKYKILAEKNSKLASDLFLTERYALYLKLEDTLYSYQIIHKPWALYDITIEELKINYQVGGIIINRRPDAMAYSNGVKVLAWNKKIVK